MEPIPVAARRNLRRSEVALVTVLALAVGIMAFEQLSVFALMPFIKPQLRLSNAQVGAVASAYWVPFALSSYGISRLAQSRGQLKLFLVILVSCVSLGSLLTGAARSAATLIAARALMGILEGPIAPLSLSLLALQSSPKHRGATMGIVGGLAGNLFGMVIAPIALVRIALLSNWRWGFCVVAVPGILCAAAIARFVEESQAPERALGGGVRGRRGGLPVTVLGSRNVWLCAVICCLFVAYLSLGFDFLPLFYVTERRFAPGEMSLLMGVLGLSAALFALLLPIASDHLGRKPIMVIAGSLSVLCPIAALYWTGPVVALACLTSIGWALSGTAGIFAGSIPSESVSASAMSAAMGLIYGVGALCGGLLGPSIGGWSADRWGLRAPLFLQAACAAAAGAIAAVLRETAPAKVRMHGR